VTAKLCSQCRWSEALVPNGRLVCTEPDVNVATPAFLAGVHAVARSCMVERGLKRGACGPAGKLWQLRPDDRVLGDA
jgi:hypothetical protein